LTTESFVSLSTVSLRLIKQPEHRLEFEKQLEKQLRETLEVPKTVAITTMPDSPLWWQRAKTIATKMESERKYTEEHPECAKSPTGKHEWRFGTCVWCGKEATETSGEVRKEATSPKSEELKKEWTPRGIEQLAEAKREEIIRFLDYLIADEMKAQKEYRRLLELLPEHKIKILEILGDEETHEKELRKILMQVTSKA